MGPEYDPLDDLSDEEEALSDRIITVLQKIGALPEDRINRIMRHYSNGALQGCIDLGAAASNEETRRVANAQGRGHHGE